MGTVCNVHTGQCQCQEGATGPRCDTCLEGYLRIPGHGCRRCDECAVSLNTEVDDLVILGDLLNRTLGNVSSVALTGARLHRFQRQMDEMRLCFSPSVDYSIDLLENNRIQELTQKGVDADNKVKVLAVQANRSHDQLSGNHKRVNQMLDDLRQIRQDVNDLIGTGNWVLDEIRGLTPEFENREPVERPAELIAPGRKIYEASNESAAFNVEETRQRLEAESELLNEVRARKEERQSQVVDLQKRLNALNNWTRIYEAEFDNVRSILTKTKAKVDALDHAQLKAFLEGVVKDAKKKTDEKAELRNKLVSIQEKLDQIRENLESIESGRPQLQELRDELKAKNDPNSSCSTLRFERSKRLLQIQKANEQTAALEEQARRIQDAYRRNLGDEAVARPLKAINIYHELRDMVAMAQNKSFHALQTANAASNLMNETANVAKERQEKSVLSRLDTPSEVNSNLEKTTSLLNDANALLDQNSPAIEDFKSRANETLERAQEAAELLTNNTQSTNDARAIT
ncbi:Laminin EGF-like domain-containing protein [Aphelenchoides fujianensis]|nr:Laminin EGF-like domain-containing protein [Aphelenchoides fujianensis]